MQHRSNRICLAGLVATAVAAAVVGSTHTTSARAASCIVPYYGAQCAPDDPLDPRGPARKPIHHKRNRPNVGYARRCQGPYNQPVTCPY